MTLNLWNVNVMPMKTRREFLSTSLVLSLFGPFLLASSKCDNTKSSLSLKDQGFVFANEPTNVYLFSFSDFPDLMRIGGSARFAVNATSGIKTISIVRLNSTQAFTALNVCPQSGCELGAFNSRGIGYSCDCDIATFDATGAVLYGAQSLNLTMFPTVINTTNVSVTIA